MTYREQAHHWLSDAALSDTDTPELATVSALIGIGFALLAALPPEPTDDPPLPAGTTPPRFSWPPGEHR